MAKVTRDEESGIATFELETREGYMQFCKGLDQGERQWAANAETNELLDFKSNNNQDSRIFVKFGDMHKQVK